MGASERLVAWWRIPLSFSFSSSHLLALFELLHLSGSSQDIFTLIHPLLSSRFHLICDINLFPTDLLVTRVGWVSDKRARRCYVRFNQIAGSGFWGQRSQWFSHVGVRWTSVIIPLIGHWSGTLTDNMDQAMPQTHIQTLNRLRI